MARLSPALPSALATPSDARTAPGDRARASSTQRAVIMAVLFLGALGLGWLILPGDAERIAMLERDGRGREALALLEHNFRQGDRSQRTLFQMQQHYEQFGELDKSRRMLEMLAELRPRDAQVQRRLALFYKQTQDVEAYIAALKRQLSLRYAEPTCRELIGLYRQRGQFDEEQAAIQSCRQQGYRRADDLIRLASLLAVDGDLMQAVSLLRSADDLWRLKSEPDRLRLFGVLLMLDQPREAVRRGVRWLRSARNEAFTDLLVDQLVLSGRNDTAIDLVRQVGTAGDAISLTVAELMLNRDDAEGARAYLRTWLDRSRFGSAAIAGRFVPLAIDSGDNDLALRAAQRFGFSRLPQAALAALVEALTSAGRATEAAAARSALTADTLAQMPQLKAPTARRQAAARAASQTSEPARELEAWRLALWTNLIGPPQTDTAAGATRQRPSAGTQQKSRTAARVLRRLKAKALRAKGAPQQAVAPGQQLAPAAPATPLTASPFGQN